MFNPDTLATWIQRMLVTKQNDKYSQNYTILVEEEACEKQFKSGKFQVHITQQRNSLWSSRERKCLFLLQQKGISRTSILQMHALMIKVSLQANVNLLTKFISTVASMLGIKYARQVFDERSHRDDAFICNMMMKAYVGHGHFDDALILYRGLRRGTGFVPDSFTFLNLAKACSSELGFWEGKEIHNHVVKGGFGSYLFVSTSLIDMYAKCMNMGCARKLFDEMVEKSEVSWTALICGYARSGDVDSVKDLFNQMPEKDTAAYNMMIDFFVKLGDVDSARSLFDQMPERNVVSWTSMIDGYCNVGDVVSAKLLFDEIPEKNLYSWNAMIKGYCQNKESHEALQLFRELQAETFLEPDNVTIVSVLPAVADLGALDLGCWIHNYVRKKKLDQYANVCTALVDMYGKCGEITKARAAFDDMSNKGIVSWNALINGLAVNGRAKEALDVFSEMKQKGFRPNDVTMIGVLSACSHGGLVEEGMRWFKEMQELKITPKIEHYGCMIDLFGRSRCLEEAEKLIKSMPYEVNEIILSTFLSACNDPRDVARAERILKKMATAKTWSDGNYIMLSNLYALERRWGDVREIKGVMRRKGTKKEVACSSIEVDSRVWEFVSGDTVHPHWCLIHSISRKLHMNMRSKIFQALELGIKQVIQNLSSKQGIKCTKMLSLVMGTLYRKFIEKDIKNLEDFQKAILDIFDTINSALPGKHYDVPPQKDVEACFKEWKEATKEPERKKLFTEFMTKNVILGKLDETSLVTGLVTPPAAMAAKRAGESLPQLSIIKSIPDVIFVPTATILALISVKVSRRMFVNNVAYS